MTDGDVCASGALGSRRRILVRLSAAVGSGDGRRRRAALDRAREAVASGDVAAREVEEALLQSYLFLGFPAVLVAFGEWRERTDPPPPEDDPLATPRRVDAWADRGARICRRVYGSAYGKLRETVAGLHPALDRWMVTEGYGKVLGRPGLELVDRELCIVGLLAAGGWEPQLHSHLRGALRAGTEPAVVDAALEAALSEVPDGGRAEVARRVWGRVRSG